MARGPARIVLCFFIAIGIAVGVYRAARLPAPPPVTKKPPAPVTTRSATTVAATKPTAPTDFLTLLRSDNPDFPTTQPLALPVELHEGARLIINEPVHLDSAAELWITRPDAPAIAAVLKKAKDEQVHLTRERVVFVHRALDDAGNWQPQLVSKQADGTFTLISAAVQLKLGARYSYHWDRAFSWNSSANEGFVVPTDTGVSVFRPRALPVELHYDFVEPPTSAPSTPTTRPSHAQPQMLLDSRGLLAWIPWENGLSGSHGAARFVDGHWIPLGADQHWPDKILHLVPLLDGSVLQLLSGDDDTLSLSLSQLDPVDVDRKLIDPLIEQLSDPDPKVRDNATNELTRYGTGLWPILEKVIDDQPPEGHLRIEQLLAAKLKPTLGRMTLLPGKGKIIARLSDGGALLWVESGVTIPAEDGQTSPVLTAPAYIAFRPGKVVEPASTFLVQDLPADATIDALGDEWVVTDGAQGPRRLLGNHLSPLLRKPDRKYSKFIGIDRQGRWLFRKPTGETPTLILDPWLPDATPRLAAWVDPVPCEAVGWDTAEWPVFAKGANAWALHDRDWAPVQGTDKDTPGKFFRTLEEMPRPIARTTAPPTTLATAPATTQSAEPLLVDSDGTVYTGGLTDLTVRKKDGTSITWPLPSAATGEGEVHLLKAGEGRLFLFNQPGRVLRVLPTPGLSEPFKLEATFTEKIPNTDHFTRVWLDPAGRIDCAYSTNHLTILFPDGRIPRPISEKMPAEQLKFNEDQ